MENFIFCPVFENFTESRLSTEVKFLFSDNFFLNIILSMVYKIE